MKRKKTLDAKKPSMIVVGVRFALAMISLAILCIGAVAEDEKSANYWYEKSLDLYNNGSLEESLQAVDKAIEARSRERHPLGLQSLRPELSRGDHSEPEQIR